MSDVADIALKAVQAVLGKAQAVPAGKSSFPPVVSDPPLWDVHVKYPPRRHLFGLSRDSLSKLPSLYRDGNVDQYGRILLDDYKILYERTRDPLLVLETFILAHQEQLYPPIWALEILCNAFKIYLNAQGAQDLGQILQLTGLPKQGSTFKQRTKRRRDLMLAEYICWYAALKPCSLEKATEMVSVHWKTGVKNGWYRFGHALDKPISAEALLQYYKRRWRAQFMCDERYMDIQVRLQALTDDEKKQFIAKIES
jgi:hypothetical protein